MARIYVSALAWWGRIGRKWRITVVSAAAALLVGSSAAGYRQWHYMQHDNRFCTTCHLMQDPFERFNRSAHARLECHSCHKATLSEQLHQLYATVIQQPTEIRTHAHVPNRVCGACHVVGDSTRWKIIANTAGHRIHLESRHPALRDVQCVTCHAVSVHEFAPVDRTCARAECHGDRRLRLGDMGQMEIHCTTCHNYLAEAPAVAVDSLGLPLTPRAAQCLRCHAMQERIGNLDIGHDPHRGLCGDCHNPHRQARPSDVNCTTGTCHAGWRRVSFHVGVAHPERCTTCHQRHSWVVEGQNCMRCHRDIERQPPTRGRSPARGRVTGLSPDAVAVLASAEPVDLAGFLHDGPAQTGSALPRFSHGDHRGQSCASCHSSRVRHGALRLRSPADCRRCHHVGPGRDQCASCHPAAELAQPLDKLQRTFRLSVSGRQVTRRIPFPHARHTAAVACTICHTDPESRAPAGADCAWCHRAHHRPTAVCTTCHGDADPSAIHRAAAHPNCSVSGCHGRRAENLLTAREGCLLCHAGRARHMPGLACQQCHSVTNPERMR